MFTLAVVFVLPVPLGGGRDAADASGEAVDPIEQRLLEDARHASGVDRLDRLLPELPGKGERTALVAGVEDARDLVAAVGERYRKLTGKSRRGSDVAFAVAPAARKAERGRQGRAQVTRSRSGLPPLQA